MLPGEEQGVVSLGIIASLNSLVEASPAKSRQAIVATFRPKSQDSLSVQFSKSVERAPGRDGVGGQCNWPVEHEVGDVLFLARPWPRGQWT